MELRLDIAVTVSRAGESFRGDRFLKMALPELLSTSEMVSVSASRASECNERRASRLLTIAASTHGMGDPVTVSKESSRLILNILFSHVKMGDGDGTSMLGKDSMTALVQGMQRCYDNNGHTSCWTVFPDGTASGNPTRGNLDLARLRKAHRTKLSEFGRTSTRATPLSAEHVCRHFSIMVNELARDHADPAHRAVEQTDLRPWALHAIWTVGLNCGLRFDELAKMQASMVSHLYQGITINLPVRTKNSIRMKHYELIDWPHALASQSGALDAGMALGLWLAHRGSDDGFLFCNFVGGRLDFGRSWDPKTFIDYMRQRLILAGEGSGNVRYFTGHSIKRGSVQLYRTLGVSDTWIMRRIHMTGEYAYLRYTEAFNDAAPIPVPEFSNLEAVIAWAGNSRLTLADGLDQEEEEAEVENPLELPTLSTTVGENVETS
jgi:hypothetical protein